MNIIRTQFLTLFLHRLGESEEVSEFSSFFDRNKFLIEDGAIQRYANIKDFDPR